jgi:hypothetical protein
MRCLRVVWSSPIVSVFVAALAWKLFQLVVLDSVFFSAIFFLETCWTIVESVAISKLPLKQVSLHSGAPDDQTVEHPLDQATEHHRINLPLAKLS